MKYENLINILTFGYYIFFILKKIILLKFVVRLFFFHFWYPKNKKTYIVIAIFRILLQYIKSFCLFGGYCKLPRNLKRYVYFCLLKYFLNENDMCFFNCDITFKIIVEFKIIIINF